MDCGWQNLEGVANIHFERLMLLASMPICIGLAAPPQTSGTREPLRPSAMMLSLQQPPDVPYQRLYGCLSSSTRRGRR
jgi:hypothetical protein